MASWICVLQEKTLLEKHPSLIPHSDMQETKAFPVSQRDYSAQFGKIQDNAIQRKIEDEILKRLKH